MNLHSLTVAKGARRGTKRLGRGMGSGVGKTCGKGHKGQMSRKGHKHKRGFEGGQMRLIRRIPHRGFRKANGKVYIPVNVSSLTRFEDGAEVDVDLLVKSGLANSVRTGIKILGQGTLDKKLSVKAHAFSAGARQKIEAAGGSCETVSAGSAAQAK